MKKLFAHLLATVFSTTPASAFTKVSISTPVPLGWDDGIMETWQLDDGRQHIREGGIFSGTIDISRAGTGFTGTNITVISDVNGINVSNHGTLVLDGKTNISTSAPDGRDSDGNKYVGIYINNAVAKIGDGANIQGGIAVAVNNNGTVHIGKNNRLYSLGGLVNSSSREANPTLYLNNGNAIIGAGSELTKISSTGTVIRMLYNSSLVLNGELKNKINIIPAGGSGIVLRPGMPDTEKILKGSHINIINSDYGIDLQGGNAEINLDNITIDAIFSGFKAYGTRTAINLSNFNITTTTRLDTSIQPENMEAAITVSNGEKLVLKNGKIQSSTVGIRFTAPTANAHTSTDMDNVTINSFYGLVLGSSSDTDTHVTVWNGSVINARENIARLLGGTTLNIIGSTMKTARGSGLLFEQRNLRSDNQPITNTVNIIGSRLTTADYGYSINIQSGIAFLKIDHSIIDLENNTSGGLYMIRSRVNNSLNIGLDLVADNGSQLYGRGIIEANRNRVPFANINLKNGSFWFIDGDSNATNIINDNSTIIFLKNKFSPEPELNDFTRLAIANDYSSTNGTITFNAALNTNNEDSPHDHLLIEGNAYGTTRVAVNNRGGRGGLTDENGINLITVNGMAENGAGTFTGRDYHINGLNVLAGGAYVYTLKHREIDGVNEWNLYSVFEEDIKPVDPTDPTNPGEGGDGGTPGKPVYGAGVSLYEAYPQILHRLNRLPTMQQRVGEHVYADGNNYGIDQQGFWIRIEGATGHFNSARSLTGMNYDLDIIKTQTGLDFAALETKTGSLIGGIYIQYGYAKANISSHPGYGDIKTNMHGFGSTLTWYQDNGFYIDAQAQAQWFHSDIYSRSHNDEKGFDRYAVNSNHGSGYAFGLEIGRTFALSRTWNITPQTQLVYSHVNFNHFHDLIAAQIVREDGNNFESRLGVSFTRDVTWKSDTGDMRSLKLYGIGNVYHEFLNGTSVSVSSVTFRNKAYRDWTGIGSGVRYDWGDSKYLLYSEVNTRTSFNNFGKSYDIQGTIGFKAKF